MPHLRENASKKHSFLISALCFFTTFIVLGIVFSIAKIVPFGNNSLLCMDANIQYVDFFKYYKDLLAGDSSIVYTLSNLLGGDTLAIFSYYLASPFNLLLVFFDKNQIPLFFTLIYTLKVSLASTTMSYFLQKRFDGKINDSFNVLLSISYGLMHYTVLQASNIMWLDAVYMLPLILLGVYRVVKDKNITLLTISVALAIIFNWYGAGIACLFSIFWFMLEFLYSKADDDKHQAKSNFKDFISKGFKYVFGMGLGVLMSCITFLPSIVTILNGKGTSKIIPSGLTGGLLSMFKSYYITSDSDLGAPTFYCGAIVLIGVMGLLFTKMISTKKKLVIISILAISISAYYVQKMYLLFSLLNYATSYFYRFSFTTIFLVIFMAALFYSHLDSNKDKAWDKKLIVLALLYSGVIVAYNLLRPFASMKDIALTVIVVITSLALVILVNKKATTKPQAKTVLSILMVIVLCFELGFNAQYLFSTKYSKEITPFDKAYTDEIEKQLNDIKANDDSQYRISQTSFRADPSHEESLAYNFWSNTAYTSCPANIQLDFLGNMGYRTESGCLTMVRTSIISADSLMGVKYVLSDFPINGLIAREDLGIHNDKAVYENPYALPMAYKVSNYNPSQIENGNPFEYQNKVYSQLLNKDIKIFEELPYTEAEDGNTVEYIIDIPDGDNYTCYGNIPFHEGLSKQSNLILNDEDEITYSGWASPFVFYLNNIEKYDSKYNVKFEMAMDDVIAGDPQFYALNLDTLKSVTDELKQSPVVIDNLGNEKLDFTVDAKSGESLVLSISDASAWSVSVNGKSVDKQRVADCFINIPLEEGQNNISMQYKIPCFNIGLVISLFALVVFIIYTVIDKRAVKKAKAKNK